MNNSFHKKYMLLQRTTRMLLQNNYISRTDQAASKIAVALHHDDHRIYATNFFLLILASCLIPVSSCAKLLALLATKYREKLYLQLWYALMELGLTLATTS